MAKVKPVSRYLDPHNATYLLISLTRSACFLACLFSLLVRGTKRFV